MAKSSAVGVEPTGKAPGASAWYGEVGYEKLYYGPEFQGGHPKGASVGSPRALTKHPKNDKVQLLSEKTTKSNTVEGWGRGEAPQGQVTGTGR